MKREEEAEEVEGRLRLFAQAEEEVGRRTAWIKATRARRRSRRRICRRRASSTRIRIRATRVRTSASRH
jgi:hypothetical protein